MKIKRSCHRRRGAHVLSGIGLALLALGLMVTPGKAAETLLHAFGTPPHGANPHGGVIRDGAGNLYGATYNGGARGLGVVYKVNTSGQIIILHNFAGGSDGQNPWGPIIRDSSGNIYGTTYYGGAHGAGIVYKLDPTGTETILHTFTAGSDGGYPEGGVIRDSAGNLYGTTELGGNSFAGVVFKIDTSGTETVLYPFTGGADGSEPTAGVTLDSSGNLYGTTYFGGNGYGVVFKLDTTNHETVLYTFTGGMDGGSPWAGVVVDSAGNLYGTTNDNGANGAGVVYMLDPAGNETVLFSFNYNNGGFPNEGVVRDPAGRLYGCTYSGGAHGLGVVYRLSPSGHETILHSFAGGSDGAYPSWATVTLDSTGTVYGTTGNGGTANAGVVYKVDSSANETVIASFPGTADGGNPYGGLVRDASGNFYGTASGGGTSGQGIVYEVSPSGQETILYTFTGGADGGQPQAGLVRDAAGNLYGTTYQGGAFNGGTVFKLDPSNTKTVLHSFTFGTDGGFPAAPLTLDSSGNLYGTTIAGGSGGYGVAFEMDPAGNETVLHGFANGSDGGEPFAGVARDSAGNIYGTTVIGGAGGQGVLFKIDTSGVLTPIHSFTFSDGAGPYGTVILDSAGNIYGTTQAGGQSGSGSVYKVDSSGTLTTLHSFNYADGAGPISSLFRDPAGNLYGTTQVGGTGGQGTVFRLSTGGTLTTVHNFTGGSDGGSPRGNVLLDSSGNIYGNTYSGGPKGTGVVFKLSTH